MTKHKQLIDWSEPSTKRGAVWFLASLLAIATSLAGDRDLAMAIFLGGATVAGLTGMIQRDKP